MAKRLDSAVKNIILGQKYFDVWNVNQDAEYHEAGSAGEGSVELGTRDVPRKISEKSVDL